MKANSSVFAAFAVGAILASLPYTLSNRHTNAQGAGPVNQGGPPPQGQFGGGQFGGGQPGAGQFNGQRPFVGGGGPMVNSMTSAGDFLFVAAGDTIYKIRIESMKIEGQTKLPQPQGQPPRQGNFNGGANPPRQGGLGGGGQVPPKK